MKVLLILSIFIFSVKAFSITESCQKFIKSLPSDYKHGFISVPENWEAPFSSKNIDVFYYYRPSLSEKRAIFFHGGPLAAEDYRTFPKLFQNMLGSNIDKKTWIIMEQRGSGCSTVPAFLSDEKSLEIIGHYNSTSIVKDAEFLRETLFGKNSTWEIFGQSYGGTIVGRYVALYPHSLSKAIGSASGFPDSTEELLYYRIKTQNAVALKFFSKYAGVEHEIRTILSQITPDTCILKSAGLISDICGRALLDVFGTSMGVPQSWDGLRKAIGVIYNNGVLNKAELLKMAHMKLSFMSNRNAKIGIGAIHFEDWGSRSSVRNSCEQLHKRFNSEGLDPKNFIFDECAVYLAIDDMETDSSMELYFNKTQPRDPLKTVHVLEGLYKNPNLEFTLFTGALDAIVPPELSYRLANFAPNRIRHVVYPNNGHVHMADEPTFWEELSK